MSLDYIESVIGINTTGTEGSLFRFFRKFRWKETVLLHQIHFGPITPFSIIFTIRKINYQIGIIL